jgi:hypothetical protein
MDEPSYTHAQFLNDAQKQLVNTAIAALSERPLEWAQVAPFLEAARSVCRDDLRLNGNLAIHGLEYEGAELVPAEEAYLAISVRDREDQVEWLSQTFWMSDLALADRDPNRVRSAIAALERTLDRVKAWLAAEEAALAPTSDDAVPHEEVPED